MATNGDSAATHARFSQLTEKVNEAQAKIKTATHASRDELQAQVERAQNIAEQQADEMKANTAQAKAQASSDWQSMKDKWQAHVADLHRSAEDKKAEHDARRAERKAEAAEGYAYDAVDFAIGAAQEAEYAVLDAILARSDADALAGNR
jgi:hypothetical protein